MTISTVTPTLHLSVAQAARRLGVSHSTVRRLVQSGLLPAARYGERGRLRIDPADLAAFSDRAWRWNG